MKDFKKRIAHYEEQYQTLDENYEPHLSFLKIFNCGRKVSVYQHEGHLQVRNKKSRESYIFQENSLNTSTKLDMKYDINCANVCSHEQSTFAVTVRVSTTQLADLVVTVVSLIVAGFEILDVSFHLKIIFAGNTADNWGSI